ncbi:hypothetical protein D3C87_1019100 [compost metagenome]
MKKRNIPLDAKVLLSPSFKSAEDFVGLVRDFLVRLPLFTPNGRGDVEPINLRLLMPEIEKFLRPGGSTIMWKRKSSPKGWGVLKKRTNPLRGPQFSSHYLDVSVESAGQVSDLIGYLRGFVEWARIEYAFCDTLTKEYVSAAQVNGLAPYKDNMNIYAHMLVRCLPDVVWSQIFGPAYVKLIGLDKLLSAPAHKVEQLGPETVYVQLSESLFDMHDRYEEVDAVRQQVKQHLDDNIFFDPRNAKEHVYRVPQFEFPD